MQKLVVSIAAATLFIGVSAQARPRTEHANEGLQRVLAISVNGQTASLKLADGKSLDIPASTVRVVESGDEQPAKSMSTARSKASAQGAVKTRSRMSLQELQSLSEANPDALPALVSVKYDRDGYVKRARVIVFSSASETKAFLDRSARRRAEMKANAKPSH
jgi:hypothetical protein